MPQIAIDLTQEHGITLGQACKYLPAYRGEGRKHPSFLTRAIQQGIRTRDNRRVFLGAVRVGSAWYTSVEAVQRFIADQQPQPADAPAAESVRPPTAARKASVEAENKLISMGC